VTPRRDPRTRSPAPLSQGVAPSLAVALAMAVVLSGAPPRAHSAGEIKRGAYCALPKPGETPKCLDPAKSEYKSFFTALDDGAVDEVEAARLEADLAGEGEGENAYLALSSISYGYYRLSQRAAAAPNVDPEIAARLERWNQVLALAYERNETDAEFRGAVRDAVIDLSENAPQVKLRCVEADGTETECDSTEVVLRGVDATAGDVGLRGALQHLLERMARDDDS
jgi:hypothetical protein